MMKLTGIKCTSIGLCVLRRHPIYLHVPHSLIFEYNLLSRAVHGGAIATMFDSVGGVLAYQLGYRCVTVNLNVNFHGQVSFTHFLYQIQIKNLYMYV